VRAHALATPLLTKADGTKFGKTESGTVWLDRELTSPYAFHQFFLNAEDAKVVDYLKVFSFRSREEIEALEKATENEPHKRLAQKALADDVTDIVHGSGERQAVVAAAAALFGRGELSCLSEETLRGIMRELKAPEVTLPMPLVDAFLVSGIVESKAAAKRAILEGGAYLNNEKVTDPEFSLTETDLLGGCCAIVRRGRRTVGGVQVGTGR
jgi:tyrosine--tRNA ligase